MSELAAYILVQASTFAVTMALAGGMAIMLPIPRRVRYFAAIGAVGLAFQLIGSSDGLLRVLSFASFTGLTLASCTGPVRFRVLAMALVYTAAIAGEAVCSVVSVALLGGFDFSTAFQLAHPVEFLFIRLLDTALIIAGSYASALLSRRVVHGGESRRAALMILFMPLLQVVLLMGALYLQLNVTGIHAALSAGIAAAALLFFAADVLLVVTIERIGQASAERERARAMERQLDGYLEQYAALARRSAAIARLRHDARNNVQVISALLDRGAYGEASAYAGECERTLAKPDGR